MQDKSGREALQSFVAGNGDVLLSYEYEATTAQKKGEDVDYVTPDDTIKIDIDIAPTTTSKNPETAQAFIDYALSRARAGAVRRVGLPPGQRRRARRRTPSKFPEPSGLFTIDDLGGWPTVNDELFDPENGSIAKIEESAGVSTEK